jgi:hypothetical protein
MTVMQEPPSGESQMAARATSRSKNGRWIKWAGYTLAGLVVIAAVANPSQEAHLRAIRQELLLRDPSQTAGETVIFNKMEYRNYTVFSTMALGGSTYSRGFLGFVWTTDVVREMSTAR